MEFIKDYSLENIKSKLAILYILNLTDIVFTIILVNTGYYFEANFLIANVVKDYTASFLIKVLLPATLLLYIYFRMQKANDYQLRVSNILISLAVGLYATINAFHILWFALLPIFMLIY
jgi:Domain of unknown function (DUF5658)